mgnify:CR=1 FL=1
MAKQGQTRKGGKAKPKKKTSKQRIRYSAPFEPKIGGGFKKQSSIRIKPTGKNKEEIFYTGPERAGPKGFGKKGKVTTRINEVICLVAEKANH